MNIKHVFLLVIIFSVFPGISSNASENTTCKSYSEKELNSIRASNNPKFITGCGIVDLLTNPTSTVGKELLGLGSRIESPKGVATVAVIVYQLNVDLPLIPFQDSIVQLVQDEKDNALSYYLNALLKQEEGTDQEALAQIKKGNAKNFNGYPKQRFDSIAQAAEMAKCGWRQSRQHAFWNSHSGAVYRKLGQLSLKLIQDYGQDAKNACFLMGQNLEKGSLTCVEKLISLSIQSNSLDDVPSNATTRMGIKKKREQAFACGERRNEDISENDVTESVDLQYYQILLEKGEAAAQDFISDFVKQKHQTK